MKKEGNALKYFILQKRSCLHPFVKNIIKINIQMHIRNYHNLSLLINANT